MSKNNQDVLNRPIHLKMLIGFSLPTILSMVFMSIYTTVDALSAVNIVMPMVFIATGIGTMFGSGGNALVAKKIGEGKKQEAREDFSLLLFTSFVVSLVISVLCFVFLKPLLRLLGSDDNLMTYCIEYMYFDSNAVYGIRYDVVNVVYNGRKSTFRTVDVDTWRCAEYRA